MILLRYICLVYNIINIALGENLSDNCFALPIAGRGQCIPKPDCPLTEILEKENLTVSECLFTNKNGHVCCPRFENTTTGVELIANRKCYALERKRVPEYIPSNAVIGGIPSLAKEFRHMVALGYGKLGRIQWRCGGSLISERFVLTAAHCLTTRDLGDVRLARVGDLNLYSTTDDADPQDIPIRRFIKHPDYIPPSSYNDIALLELEKAVMLTEYVNPICLQTTYEFPQEFGEPLATGWGDMEFGGNGSDHLMKVDLRYYSNEKCKGIFNTSSKRQLPYGIIDEKQICAGGVNDVKDTCKGDSGGPLHARNEYNAGPYVLVGITSLGVGCGIVNVPGVYTRISHYIPWIAANVWPNE